MRTWRFSFLTLFLALASTNLGLAQAQTGVDFQRDIRPILANSCFKCHGPALQKSGVRLDSHEAALKKKAIVPGKADASKLIERILADEEERMPPKEAGERLKPAQVELLKKWIAQGAEYTPHWAFVKPEAADGSRRGKCNRCVHPGPAGSAKAYVRRQRPIARR